MATLSQEVTIATNQLNNAVNDVDRDRLTRQISSLIQEMKDVEARLRQLETSQGDRNRQHLNWHVTLPKIDFKEAVAIAQELLLNRKDNCAALLFLQNSLQMGGKWCVQRIRELLNETTLDLKHYQIEFTTSSQPNEHGMLDMLGRYLNIKPAADDPERYARMMVERIQSSLQSGSVVLIELRGIEFIHDQARLLSWFINFFWIPLVRQLPSLSQIYSNLRILLIVSADETISPDSVPPNLRCTREAFHPERFLELPLQNWTSEEIQEWLGFYSGMGKQDIILLTRKIYNSSSNGMPALVYQALSQHLSPEAYK